MDREYENAIFKLLKKNLKKFLSEKPIGKNDVKVFKEKVRNELENPKFSIKTNKLAELIIVYLINIKRIKNQEDLNFFLDKAGFLGEHCIIKDISKYKDKIMTDLEIDPELLEIVDMKSIEESHQKLKKSQVVQNVIEEETSKKINLELKKLEKYSSLIDEGIDRPEEEILMEIDEQHEFPYLEKKFDWFKEIGLKSDPFPSREGLELIDQNLYDFIVTQTPIYKKYLRVLNSSPNLLLNKSMIIYGEWGCGKTTFFEYFGYKCLQKDFFPIQVLLNAEGSLQKLKDAFRNELFRIMADYITQVTLYDPRSYLLKRNEDQITLLFEMIKNDHKKYGFFIFLDGLHKSQDENEIPLKFLNELQNILGIFKRRNIQIGIFIAGSNDWKQNISYSSIFSGSIYQHEKMLGINENQAYDMITKRITAFSDKTGDSFIDYKDIQRLFNTIRRTRAKEIPFRIFIQEFLSRGFISGNSIKFDLRLEQDILQAITEILKRDLIIYKILEDLANKFNKEVSKFIKIQNILSLIYEERRVYDDDKNVLENKAIFQLLLRNKLIKKKIDESNKKIFFWLEKDLYDLFLKIEKRVKFSPRYYLDKILCEKTSEVEKMIEFDKNIDALKRWIYTNPHYESELEKISENIPEIHLPLIEKIEKNKFEINQTDLQKMDKMIIQVLRLIYDLAGEPYRVENDEDFFNIFRYTWLDNQELTYFLNARQSLKGKITSNKQQHQFFLKAYVDAFDAQISKIGKFLSYSDILNVGSNELTDNEKRILNQARALYFSSKYKECVNSYFDLIEEKCRQWIFNIMELIFGLKWKSYVPQFVKNDIDKRKTSDKRRYGTPIMNENELYYISRGCYEQIFLYKKLWKPHFSLLLGQNNKETITKYEQISNIANKVKHNQKDTDLKDIAINIKEGLKYTQNILSILNRGYRNLLDPKNINLNDDKLILCWSNQLNQLDPNIFMQYHIDKKLASEILERIKEYHNKQVRVRGNYINIGDRSNIEQIFSCSYLEFIPIICFLSKTNKIKVVDYEGSQFLFSVKI